MWEQVYISNDSTLWTQLQANPYSATMDLLFGRRKTPEEMLRQNQRALNRAMRELDRERQKLETQEKKIISDIKKMAKQGQMVKEKKGRSWSMKSLGGCLSFLV